MILPTDEHFMIEALKEARKASACGEMPVGAVVVSNRSIIARAHNQVDRLNDATAHAEMLAVTAAMNYLGSKYLTDCTLYVTLEPCSMCAGALFWAQLGKLVFGARDTRHGYFLAERPLLHPRTELLGGVCMEESQRLIKVFFGKVRVGKRIRNVRYEANDGQLPMLDQ